MSKRPQTTPWAPVLNVPFPCHRNASGFHNPEGISVPIKAFLERKKILLCFPLGTSGFNKRGVESKGSSARPEALSALKLCVAVREEQELLSVVAPIVFLVWEQKAVSLLGVREETC